MGLQIAVSYAQLQRTLDVAPRPAERPLVVGRSSHADIQITSAHISRRHCILFMDNRRWVLQDAQTAGGTYLNGQRIDGPKYLHTGDIITLGAAPDAPTLTINPRVPAAAAVSAPAAARAPQAPVDDDYVDLSPALAEAALPDPSAGLGAARRSGVSAGAQFSPATWALGIGVTAAILGASGVALYLMRDRISQIGQVKRQVVVVTLGGGPTTAPGSSSRPPSRLASPRQHLRQQPGAAPVASPAGPGRPQPTSQPQSPAPAFLDPATTRAMEDPAWQQIEEAHRMSPPAVALVIYDDYRTSNPDAPLQARLAGYVDDAIDSIWWQRLGELCARRKELTDQMAQLDKDPAGAQSPQTRDGRAPRRQDLADRLQEIQQSLRQDMGWEALTAPDVQDPRALDKLRPTRDARRYELFKKRVLACIHRTRGLLPWQAE